MKIRSAVFAFVLCLFISGCSGINFNINVNDNADVLAKAEGDYLEELEGPNSFDALIEKNGRLLYAVSSYMKDGSSSEYTIYKDDKRYVVNDDEGTLIIEDNEAYGYDKGTDCPYRMLFADSFDEFAANTEYTSFYIFNTSEEITSREEKDGLIRLETVMPGSGDGGLIEYFGYAKGEADTIICEYTIDAATDEILELNSYVVIDGKKTLYSAQTLEKDAPEYIPDQSITDGVFGEDVRTVTAVADAGSDSEKKYTQTVKKGGSVHVYSGSSFYDRLYTDSGCVTPLSSVDRSADATVYLKRRVDYSDEKNWAYHGEGEAKDADLFLIAPTVDTNDEYHMSMDDEKTKEHFLGALNMERGIYENSTRMFAPYYRQGAMKIYSMTPEEREPYLLYAYDDVSEAFRYYLENENQGRPIVLAGFSQGADMCYRLLEDYSGDEDIQKKLVAVYAIGWPCTEEMADEFLQIRPAASETDTGVVVSFDCEAPDVTDTFITPEGTKAYTINPLNWKTDDTPADKSLNIGACFTDYDANITNEVKGLCGCYIDGERGIVKVPDLDPADYPAIVPGLPEGAYHIYDYQFFFRNLEENVEKRVESYLNSPAEGQ